MCTMRDLVPTEQIERAIFIIRGHKVMLDVDLARLYGVTTFNLNKAVKRNLDRFPDDFMFQLTYQEVRNLIFQSGMSNASGRGGRRHLPYAFTEQGIAMLSSVLRSKTAISVNIAIMRAFVRLRALMGAHADLREKLAELERKVASHDAHIQALFEAIRRLMAPDPPKPRRIGFRS